MSSSSSIIYSDRFNEWNSPSGLGIRSGKEITLPLIPVTSDGQYAPYDPLALPGLIFEIDEKKFLSAIDTGNTGIIVDERTAAVIDLNHFPRGKDQSMFFPETNTHGIMHSYRAPLTISPSIATIETDIKVGSNDLVQPMTFLPYFDIVFEYNVIKFKQKSSGYRIPYLPHDPTHPVISLTMGSPSISSAVSFPGIIDTGSTGYSIIPAKLAHEIDINRYHKVRVYDDDTNKFEYNYLIPVSIANTPVHFMTQVRASIHANKILIAAQDLLKNFGFVLKDHGMEFYRTVHQMAISERVRGVS